MRFEIRGSDDYVEAVYAEDEMVDDPFLGLRWDETVRIIATAPTTGNLDRDEIDVWMQHLKNPSPLYGRGVTMSFREFSAFVDALSALRDRLAK